MNKDQSKQYISEPLSKKIKSTETTAPCTEENNNNNKDLQHQSTSTNFKPRYTGPPFDQLTPSQKQIQDSILQSRPKTGLSGPFGPWLANPSICAPAQSLGKVCRYDTSLTKYQSEIVILLTGAKHCSHTEFDIHVGEALDAGVSMEVIQSIPRDGEFTLKNVEDNVLPLIENEKDRSLILFTTQLLMNSGLISDELYDEAKRIVGEGKDEVLVEITSIIGYYTFVAYTLNVFRIPSK
mmetsp:Transcript_4557/g.6681  ORF Transcript_4557/g.6681 Transcript_4557/m.6681 type:complete len:238 (-) Transcript_4557:112-825(-)|eukprot:CAMPEP_0203674934 /NCGR_PEP_ID=MMETSP0090-20130426/18019_1 /ASSEMBLY_ACC=CAM_ASM_001088 /TAXON_ID=426623 /ORGANISM="Chaetoceros affinis, Strain CCMP159" /LENGTH=237 /DNA_ID=CAMNT_0050540947 /DNA_START=111 /DNA_END=824 /DNA_ORIENTATION=-